MPVVEDDVTIGTNSSAWAPARAGLAGYWAADLIG